MDPCFIHCQIPHENCYKIVNTLPSDIFKVSAILRNFNLRSTKTILWTFLCFLEQLPNLEQSSYDTCQAIVLLERYYFPLKSNTLSTHAIQIFPLY